MQEVKQPDEPLVKGGQERAGARGKCQKHGRRSVLILAHNETNLGHEHAHERRDASGHDETAIDSVIEELSHSTG